jgi:predicted DsbA family dithiol-disulfide isomerase
LQAGQKAGDLDTSVTIAAQRFSLDANQLRTAAISDEVRQRVADSTAEFHAHQLTQRPAFIITSSIGDKAVFSGVINRESLVNTLDSMLSDNQSYHAFSDQFGPMPIDRS